MYVKNCEDTPADSNNMIDMGMRSLLIEDGQRLILIDTGMGNKQSDKFFGYYYQFGDFSLDTSLAKYGFHRDDITDVFLTHLHFDHCGGSIEWNSSFFDFITSILCRVWKYGLYFRKAFEL